MSGLTPWANRSRDGTLLISDGAIRLQPISPMQQELQETKINQCEGDVIFEEISGKPHEDFLLGEQDDTASIEDGGEMDDTMDPPPGQAES